MHNFHDKLIKVHDRVHKAALAAGRAPESIKILAVSKTRNAETVAEAIAAGQRCFGENYLQEALDKQLALTDLNLNKDIEWHFIGPIQSNKTRAIADNFAWVHSVDRLKIAQRLSEQRPSTLAPLKICLQINIDKEASKSGVLAEQVPALARAVNNLPGLELTGLMAIPLPRSEFSAQLGVFQKVAILRDQLQEQLGRPIPTLSMGMSADLEAAIAAGSTLVRVGTDLFGPRNTANG